MSGSWLYIESYPSSWSSQHLPRHCLPGWTRPNSAETTKTTIHFEGLGWRVSQISNLDWNYQSYHPKIKGIFKKSSNQTQTVLKILKLLSILKGWVGEWVRYQNWIETTKTTIQKLRVYSEKSSNQTQTVLKLLKLLSISKGWVGEWVRYPIWIETTKTTIQKLRVYSKKSSNQTQTVLKLLMLLSISKGWVGEWVRYPIWIETTKATIQKLRVY